MSIKEHDVTVDAYCVILVGWWGLMRPFDLFLILFFTFVLHIKIEQTKSYHHHHYYYYSTHTTEALTK